MKNMNVLHIGEGAHWAGIEAHLSALLGELRRMPEIDRLALIVFNQGLLSQRIEAMGLETICLPRKRKFDWSVLRQITRIINTQKTSIIHTHGYLASIYGMLATIFARQRQHHIITLHQRAAEQVSWKMRLYVKTMMFMAKIMRVHFVAVSKDVRASVLQRISLHDDEITVIYNGIVCDDSSRMETDKAKMGLDPQKKAIGIVGRLVKGKGHHFFIRLSKALSEIREDLEFLIIGDGPLADEIRLNIKQMNMDGNIKMLGFRSDVIDYINCLDILTLCSDHEGIPYVVLEALKCRTPIVSTNVGGIPEVISSGYNGILTGHGDCEEMKSKILELLDRPSMLNMITQNGYDTLLNKFSTPKMAQETVALYRKILSEKGEKND